MPSFRPVPLAYPLPGNLNDQLIRPGSACMRTSQGSELSPELPGSWTGAARRDADVRRPAPDRFCEVRLAVAGLLADDAVELAEQLERHGAEQPAQAIRPRCSSPSGTSGGPWNGRARAPCDRRGTSSSAVAGVRQHAPNAATPAPSQAFGPEARDCGPYPKGVSAGSVRAAVREGPGREEMITMMYWYGSGMSGWGYALMTFSLILFWGA